MASDPLPFDPVVEARRQWGSRWGDGPARAMAAVASVMRVQQILLASLNEQLRPFGLTFARYEALMLLLFSSQGSMPLGKMGERLQVHRASVTNIIDRLERDGLVARRPGGADRRSTLAEITPAGRELAARATRVLNASEFSVPGLDDDRLDALIDVLRSVRLGAGDFEDAP